MTFNQIQEKMNTVFEAIGRLSTELEKSKAELFKLWAEEAKYREGVSDAEAAYGTVKGLSVVGLATFKNAKNNLEDNEKILQQVKLKILVTKAQIDILERDLRLYKDQYSKLEDQMQQHDNVVSLLMSNEKKQKKTKPTLEQLVKRYPNGCPDHVISKFLGITEKELNERYLAIVACLRQQMKV